MYIYIYIHEWDYFKKVFSDKKEEALLESIYFRWYITTYKNWKEYSDFCHNFFVSESHTRVWVVQEILNLGAAKTLNETLYRHMCLTASTPDR